MKQRLTSLIALVHSHPRGFTLGLIFLGILGLSVLYLFNPATASVFPTCIFRKGTGYLCPGCGSGRGMHQLLHGNLLAAWQLNPMMVLILPIMFWAAFAHFSKVFFNRPIPFPFVRPVWIWLFLGAMLMFTVVRNF